VTDERRGELSRGQWLLVRVAPVLIRLLSATWRVRVLNDGGWVAHRARGDVYVFAFWHGQMLPLIRQHAGEGVAILISEHRDGELIAQIIERFGLRTVRGSTSRGAARALVSMVRTLEGGIPIGVTPDGPRGPAHSFAPGTLVAAQRAGAPVVAVGVAASRAWRLKSWDAFLIPKPFARVVIAYSDPTPVAANDARDAAQQAERFRALMHDTEARAQTYGRTADVR